MGTDFRISWFALRFFGVLLSIYVLAYFVIMARNVPAVSAERKLTFRSCYRGAAPVGRSGPLTISVYEVSVFNYIFYPMDCLYYLLAPPGRSLNTLPIGR